jgi:hypothetical protein
MTELFEKRYKKLRGSRIFLFVSIGRTSYDDCNSITIEGLPQWKSYQYF